MVDTFINNYRLGRQTLVHASFFEYNPGPASAYTMYCKFYTYLVIDFTINIYALMHTNCNLLVVLMKCSE